MRNWAAACVGGEVSPRQVRFEWDRVQMALNRFRLHDCMPDMLNDHEHRLNTPRLTFEGFRRFFPTFPVLFEAVAIPGIENRCGLADLFRRFPRTIVNEHYLEAYARYQGEAAGRPVGLVIPFGGYRGDMVVHNGQFDTRRTRLVHDVPGDRPPHRVTVEPYERLLAYLARGGWTHVGPSNAESPAEPDHAGREMRFDRWMVERLGSGPALVVLAWLTNILTSSAGLARRYVRRDADGERLIAATYADIAEETGLGVDAVKRGVSQLRKESLIVTATWHRRTSYQVIPQT